jgi:aspartate/methionine/tyrosine aminotransferase
MLWFLMPGSGMPWTTPEGGGAHFRFYLATKTTGHLLKAIRTLCRFMTD